MKTATKIILSGVVGTTFMTLYSYLASRREKQQYVEPVLLNKLISKGDFVSLQNDYSHPAGWLLHFGTGTVFMTLYRLLWRKATLKPTVLNTFTLGVLSGLAGIVIWRSLFKLHDNPPRNYRYGYYRQLLVAHIIFSMAALPAYKALGKEKGLLF
jgi:hypothetical protein